MANANVANRACDGDASLCVAPSVIFETHCFESLLIYWPGYCLFGEKSHSWLRNLLFDCDFVLLQSH